MMKSIQLYLKNNLDQKFLPNLMRCSWWPFCVGWPCWSRTCCSWSLADTWCRRARHPSCRPSSAWSSDATSCWRAGPRSRARKTWRSATTWWCRSFSRTRKSTTLRRERRLKCCRRMTCSVENQIIIKLLRSNFRYTILNYLATSW